MKRTPPAPSPDAYVNALSGWQHEVVQSLRTEVRGSAKLLEAIKWGNLVYFSNGPVCLIRAEEQRILFGFWRGKRLRDVEERLRPGGKYEMASVELRAGDAIEPVVVRKLTKAAAKLNQKLGDPTKIATKRKNAP